MSKIQTKVSSKSKAHGIIKVYKSARMHMYECTYMSKSNETTLSINKCQKLFKGINNKTSRN